MQLAIDRGTAVGPRPEHGGDGAPQLIVRPVREVPAGLGADDVPEGGRQPAQVIGLEFDVQRDPFLVLGEVKGFLEQVGIDAHDHIGIHLEEAPVAVIGKPRIARVRRQAFNRLLVQPEVEDRIHHPRHRHPGARPHRDQQRVCPVAERGADALADPRNAGLYLGCETGRADRGVRAVSFAGLGGDGEPGGDRKAEPAHLRKIGALAAEQAVHRGVAVRGPAAEAVDPLGHAAGSRPAVIPRCRKSPQRGSSCGRSRSASAGGSCAVPVPPR